MRQKRRLPTVLLAVLAVVSSTVTAVGAPAQATPAPAPARVAAPLADPPPGASSYAYDAAGRLVGVVAADGAIARYTYDAAGNILSVDRLGTPAIAVLSAVPSRVRAGDVVTLTGKGFGTTVAANTVKINGTTATVKTAAADKLTVTVPAAATSGPVTVTTSAGTATLAGVTVIANDKPTISGFTPTTAPAGTVVTLAVTNPDPEFANNLVRINGILAAVTARTATTLTVTVPPGVGSGTVQLSTPAGTATSTAVLVVPPAPATPAELDTAASIPVGTATPVPVAAGKYALRYFSAADGERFAVQLDGGTFGYCGLDSWAFDERNKQTGSANCVGGSGWIEPGPKTGAGLRSLLVRNTSGSAGTTNVTIHKVPNDLAAGAQSLAGVAKTVTVASPGQNAYTTFTGAVNQRVLIQSSGASPAFGCCGLNWWLEAPDGTRVGSTLYPNYTLNTTTLTQAGTYKIWMDPSGAAVGSLTFTAWTVPADLNAGAQPLDGTAKTVTIADPGRNAYTTFAGTVGQRVLIQSSGGSPAFGCCGLTWWLAAPDGTRVGSTFYPNYTLNTIALPQTGTYKVIVDPDNALVGSLTFAAWTVPADADAGGLPLTGAAKTVTVASPGQNAFTTFAGTTGQRVIIQSSNASPVFGCCGLTWWLQAPDGTRVGSTFYPNYTLNTIALPQTGTYKVIVDPDNALVGSIDLAAWDVPADADAGTLSLSGTAKTVTVASPGQNAFTTFAGTTGQRVLIQSSNASPVFGCCGLTWWLQAPDGTRVGSTFYPNYTLNTIALPQTGTYKVIVDPDNALAGSIDFKAWTVPADVDAGAQALDGTTRTVTNSTPGQNGYSTFSGTADQRVIIQSSNASSVFGCCGLTWWLQAPDGTRVGSTFYPNYTLNTIALPQTGTYKVIVDPDNALTGSIDFKAWNVPADADTGTLPLTGATKTITVANPGQNAYSGFSGTAGQRIVFQSSASSPAFGCCGMNWWVTGPDGNRVGSTQYPNYSLDITLPTTGAYKLVVDPNDALVGGSTFTATVTAGLAAVAPAPPPPAAANPVAVAKTEPNYLRADVDKPARISTPPNRETVVATDPDSPNAATPLPDGDPRTSAAWKPDAGSLAGNDWLTRRADPGPVTDLVADKGITAVSGHVRGLDGAPLAGIPVRVDDVRTTTDAQGRFLVRGVRPNATTVIVDGYAAKTEPARYGTFRIRAKVVAGATTALDATVWLPRLDTRHTQKLDAPTSRETVLTTPDIPGLEVRVPAGSVVRDMDGNVVRELGITAIPLDRAPYPLPRNGIVPVYFTVQPGGATIFPQGASVVYPNYTSLPAGSEVEFWNYDPLDKGWYVYGHGKVSADARQVVPDDKTKLWTFDGAMFNTGGNPKPDKPWWQDLIDKLSGDPVDLSTGLLTDSHTDLGLGDTLPVTLTRQYYQGDNHSREFGLNSGSDFNLFLASEQQYQEVDVYTPGGGRAHYVRTSPGTGYSDAVFGAVGSPGRFTGSTVAQVNGDWVLSLRDGTKFFFPWYSRARAMQDRNGNQVTFTRTGGSNGEVSQITSPSGRWISFEYDASARVTRAFDNIGRQVLYTYDTGGRLSTVTDVAGKVSTYTYDTANRITKITDARGVAYLDVVYDANGRVQRQNLADGGNYQFAYTLNAANEITETRVTQPNGSVRRVVFDANHMVSTDTAAYGTTLARTTTYVRGTDNRVDAVIDPYGRRTNYTYDAQQRVTAVTELVGTADQVVSEQVTYGPFDQPLTTKDPAGKTTTYTYDAKGNPLTATNPASRKTTMAWNSAGQVTTVTAPGGAATTFTYEAGAATSVKDPLGRVTKMFVDAAGRRVQETDPSGAATLTAYDAQNQPVKVTDPLGGVSQFAYDANGNLTTYTDQRGKTTRWAYDGQDRATSTTDPLNRTSTVTYDPAGRVTAAVSRAGVRTEATYDALDRSTRTRYGVTSATAQQSQATLAYDALDRLATVTDSAGGTTTYAHDARDRVTSTTGPNGTVGYGYDAVGRQTTTTLPGLPTTTYTYDAAGAFTGVTRGTDSATITRDTAGRPATVTLPGGWAQTLTYDTASQVTGIAYSQAGTAKGALAYTYDASGRRTAVTGALAQTTLPAARTGLTYDDANKLLTTDGAALTYDDDGNLTADGTTAYTWNARGQLTGTSRTGLTGTYAYDAAGDRSSRTVGATTTKFLYDGTNVAAELDGAGALSASLLSGGVDQWFGRTKAGVTDTTLTDALGSAIGFGRADGTLAANQAFDPFGVPTATGDKRGSDLSFTGRQDDGTGLDQYRARYYSPSLGRFISEDPIGISGGSNLYAYTQNSPTNLTDPSGNNPLVGCLVGGLIGGGLDYAGQRLAGRKVDWGWGGVGGAAAGGCAMGALGGLLGGLGKGMPALPEALTVGRNADKGVDVYKGIKNGKDVYSGITNNLANRTAQHGSRFDYLQRVTAQGGVTRGEARAIEQALINRSQGLNKINSISPSHPYYQQAVNWGNAWLRRNGF
ncbi:RHS repeat-associated core domain-containing protein [Umezawaea sp. Da 62-37]|uniref:RHS repeat-associated core domain-containing protein n=1 Tax=Umezawaea sp. Da 62-37 TaxID=3075927 RepID=UPI0028F73763|nr:RHS repeat-associated core domain-containing protein [Umezawaea sp. Da 62-37]WNV87867.1 RHS repeat-associated core domain-containing protein [Umezawaea sp. Da 62-37]